MEQIYPRLLDFDQNRNPVRPRDAATVIVLRDGRAGLEVFCVRRHASSSFMGGAVVFPGGKVDAQDGTEVWRDRATEPPARAAAFATEEAPARALCVAACRETLEEGAILPTDAALSGDALDAVGRELAAGTPLDAALERRGLKLALGALVPWARWITPLAEQRRFDARFFLLPLPRGQVGRHDGYETTTSFWAAPTAILERAGRGEIFLAPPTSRTLELLSAAADVRSAVALAERQSLLPICPRFVPGDGAEPPYLALPGDPSHETRERGVEGPTRYVLRNGRFVAEEPCARGSPIHIKQEREPGSTTSFDAPRTNAPSVPATPDLEE
ncbi:NUDIX hydrolase [Sorangium sp. So ce1097]|uniref:NUDIX hydrolase n=1 Tax=Sorangium sp. So ce1097 TaxID=3133330 RepID=UPI003F5F88F7